jgi:hypothetical protein
MLRGPGYRRLGRGAYWLAGAPVTHGRRIQAFRQVLPPDAVLGGLSAAWAWGLRWAQDHRPVEVLPPHEERVRSRAGLRVRGDRLAADEIANGALGLATVPARTASTWRQPRPT